MFNLYNILALTEVKGYAMLQFSYMMLNIFGEVGRAWCWLRHNALGETSLKFMTLSHKLE